MCLYHKSHIKNLKEPLEEGIQPMETSVLLNYAARGPNPASLRLHIYSLIGPLMCAISFSDSSGVLQRGQVAHIRLRL
jgi:hypothetical protein